MASEPHHRPEPAGPDATARFWRALNCGDTAAVRAFCVAHPCPPEAMSQAVQACLTRGMTRKLPNAYLDTARIVAAYTRDVDQPPETTATSALEHLVEWLRWDGREWQSRIGVSLDTAVTLGLADTLSRELLSLLLRRGADVSRRHILCASDVVDLRTEPLQMLLQSGAGAPAQSVGAYLHAVAAARAKCAAANPEPWWGDSARERRMWSKRCSHLHHKVRLCVAAGAPLQPWRQEIRQARRMSVLTEDEVRALIADAAWAKRRALVLLRRAAHEDAGWESNSE